MHGVPRNAALLHARPTEESVSSRLYRTSTPHRRRPKLSPRAQRYAAAREWEAPGTFLPPQFARARPHARNPCETVLAGPRPDRWVDPCGIRTLEQVATTLAPALVSAGVGRQVAIAAAAAAATTTVAADGGAATASKAHAAAPPRRRAGELPPSLASASSPEQGAASSGAIVHHRRPATAGAPEVVGASQRGGGARPHTRSGTARLATTRRRPPLDLDRRARQGGQCFLSRSLASVAGQRAARARHGERRRRREERQWAEEEQREELYATLAGEVASSAGGGGGIGGGGGAAGGWLRASHVQTLSTSRLAAPRRAALPSARTPFSVSDNPALFDLATLRCVSNYYRATGRVESKLKSGGMQAPERDSRGRGYGYGTGTTIRLHAPSLLTTHGCADKSMPT